MWREPLDKLVRKGHFGKAEKVIRKALSGGLPQSAMADALFRLGNVHARDRHFPGAVFLFRQALQAAPDHPAILANLGSAYKEQGRLDRAVAAYQKALARQPDHALVHSNLAGVLQELGDAASAERHARRAVSLDAGLVQAHINLGVALKALGRLDEAEVCQRTALTLSPDSSEAYCNLASLALEQRAFQQAVDLSDAALRLNPNNHSAMANRAGGLYFSGRKQESLGEFERASQGRGGIDGKGQINYGLALRECGGPERERLLAELETDHRYPHAVDAMVPLTALAQTLPMPPSQSSEPLDRFLKRFSPDKLYPEAWWRETLARFGDPRFAPDKVLRAVFSKVFSWSLPTREGLEAIATAVGGGRLASYGAGGGYWEYLLATHFSVPVVASDLTLGHRFIEMTSADFRTAPVAPDDTVLLAWVLNSPPVVAALLPLLDRMVSGQRLILVGDTPDEGGRARTCGTEELFTYLDRHFELERRIDLVRFAYLHDEIWQLRKR